MVRVAFERNFMKSCLAGVKGSTGTAYCLCTRDALDDAFSDKELPEVTPSDPRVLNATHSCAAKYGLPITPGH